MGRFTDWYFQPVVDLIEEFRTPRIISKPVVSLKEVQKVSTYRPSTFADYVGQEKAKQTLRSYIKGVQKRNLTFPHTIIHGNAGCGKTTLARIIANELNIPIMESIASEIKDPHDIVWKLQQFEETSGIVFLDEAHAMERNIVEGLYPLMEDFTYNGKGIQPFTLIGATTELGEMIENRRPFVERFKLWIELEGYVASHITEIVKRYKSKMFATENLGESLYDIIGKNSRNTPRTGIRLLEACVMLDGNVSQVLSNFNILKDGYTNRDLKLLNYLKDNDKGVGLQSLCSYLDISSELYMYEIEPYLLQNGLIIRTSRGRKIANAGIIKLEELKKV